MVKSVQIVLAMAIPKWAGEELFMKMVQVVVCTHGIVEPGQIKSMVEVGEIIEPTSEKREEQWKSRPLSSLLMGMDQFKTTFYVEIAIRAE